MCILLIYLTFLTQNKNKFKLAKSDKIKILKYQYYILMLKIRKI